MPNAVVERKRPADAICAAIMFGRVAKPHAKKKGKVKK
jgi:hypothetical protein